MKNELLRDSKEFKNELLGKDEISISVGGVDFTGSKIAEMIRSHTQQNKKAAEILRAQMIELDRVKVERDAYAKALRVALKEGVFFNKPKVKNKLETILQKLKGGV